MIIVITPPPSPKTHQSARARYYSHPSRPKNSSTYTSLLFLSFLICFEIATSASATILICVFAAGSFDAFASAVGNGGDGGKAKVSKGLCGLGNGGQWAQAEAEHYV